MDTKSKPKMTILITGADGFIGRNLVVQLQQINEFRIIKLTRKNSANIISLCQDVDFVFHLAGENRPKNIDEYQNTNVVLTKTLLNTLSKQGRSLPVVFSSSTQAVLDNPYGKSKRKAEELIFKYGEATSSPVFVFRLPNVFGKWAKPNYNSVVATFCYNLVHDIPLKINDPASIIDLVHIDDTVKTFVDCINRTTASEKIISVEPAHKISVGELAKILSGFWQARQKQMLPNLSSRFNKALYGTFSSYYEMNKLAVKPALYSDERGWLFELVKSTTSGQIFVSSTKPGFTRGDHWHHTKVEKFTVIKGRGTLLFRNVNSDKILSYELSGEEIEIVDIPTGYIHSIHNKGSGDMLLLIWASEILDKNNPDTYYEKVA